MAHPADLPPALSSGGTLKRAAPSAEAPPVKRLAAVGTHAPLAPHDRSIPIQRGRFKNRYLRKHSAFVHRSDRIVGVLITTQSSLETRALGQARRALDHYAETLFPAHAVLPPEAYGELEIDLALAEKAGLHAPSRLRAAADADTAATPAAETLPAEADSHGAETEMKTAAETPARAHEAETKCGTGKRFQAIDTACQGSIFLRFRIDVPPHRLIEAMFEATRGLPPRDVARLQHQLAATNRWLPVSHVCPANRVDIAAHVPRVLADYDMAHSLAIVAEVRSHPTLTSAALRDTVAAVLPRGLTINLSRPDIVLWVSVYKSVCLFSLLPDYYPRKKYHLVSWLTATAASPPPAATDVDAAAAPAS